MSLPQETGNVWTYILSASGVASILVAIFIKIFGKWFDKTDNSASKEYVDKEVKQVVTMVKEDVSRILVQIDKLDRNKADWRSYEDLKATVLRVDSKADDILKAISTRNASL